MTAETVLALAKAQGFSITPARAQEIAAAIAATLASVNRIPVPFEAEPAAFLSALEALAR
jgi:uncharacterized protein (DUF697 family)